MTNNADQGETLPLQAAADSGAHAPPDTAPVAQSKPVGDKKPRPKTVLELVEYAYAEAGRKLNLVRRDLGELKIDPEAADAEMDSLRRSAADDPCLAVPPSILLSLAELRPDPVVRRRILELIRAALAIHPVFAKLVERLVDPTAEPVLTAQDVSEAARSVTFDALGFKEKAEFKAGSRERLRVNAITAFELYRVLNDGWTLDRFVTDMASLVWDAPGYRDAPTAVSVLVSAKTADALSQLSRHYERLLHDADQQTRDARAEAAQQARRAEAAESGQAVLSADLAAAEQRRRALDVQVADLSQRLAAEQRSRVVDKSHLVDDYELLRTQVIRRLSAQVELLGDGLHALRSGSTSVAEEFLDRALTAISGELTRLKALDEGGQ